MRFASPGALARHGCTGTDGLVSGECTESSGSSARGSVFGMADGNAKRFRSSRLGFRAKACGEDVCLLVDVFDRGVGLSRVFCCTEFALRVLNCLGFRV